MQRLIVFLKLMLLAILLAASYGIVHDQLSYTLSPEYYTRFKFIQFHVPWAYSMPRVGAAFVGALATWWLGLIIATLLYLFRTSTLSNEQMFKSDLQSYAIVFVVAVAVTLGGLLLAYQRIDAVTVEHYRLWLRPGVTDPVQFVRVGFMHNASYLGGIAGLCTALIWRLFKNYRARRSQRNKSF